MLKQCCIYRRLGCPGGVGFRALTLELLIPATHCSVCNAGIRKVLPLYFVLPRSPEPSILELAPRWRLSFRIYFPKYPPSVSSSQKHIYRLQVGSNGRDWSREECGRKVKIVLGMQHSLCPGSRPAIHCFFSYSSIYPLRVVNLLDCKTASKCSWLIAQLSLAAEERHVFCSTEFLTHTFCLWMGNSFHLSSLLTALTWFLS